MYTDGGKKDNSQHECESTVQSSEGKINMKTCDVKYKMNDHSSGWSVAIV